MNHKYIGIMQFFRFLAFMVRRKSLYECKKGKAKFELQKTN
jgi:hypothetical protein